MATTRSIPFVQTLLRALVICGALVMIASCGDPPNTQILPIGERCKGNDDCGTTPYDCQLGSYPGGYCEKACTTEGDCPTDSTCVNAAHCRRKCGADMKCRETEGYTCIPRSATSGALAPYCDLPVSGS